MGKKNWMELAAWFYKNLQSESFLKSKTIVWHKYIDEDANGNPFDRFYICVNSIVRETDKAVQVDCSYWWLGRRDVSFEEYTGYKVWIPKSVIRDYGNVERKGA